MHVETEHISLLWHPLNKHVEGGNTLSVNRFPPSCSGQSISDFRKVWI